MSTSDVQYVTRRISELLNDAWVVAEVFDYGRLMKVGIFCHMGNSFKMWDFKTKENDREAIVTSVVRDMFDLISRGESHEWKSSGDV